MDQDKVTYDLPESKEAYVLLDWGGNVDDEKQMTASEAKKANQLIFEKGDRLQRWARKKDAVVKKYNGDIVYAQ